MITGNQCFFALGGSDILVGFLTGMGEIEQSVDALEQSVLSDVQTRKYRTGDLYEPGQLELRFFMDMFDTNNMWSLTMLNPANAVLTYQLARSDSTDKANLSGSGHFVSRIYPELINDQLALARATWQWDGYSGVGQTPSGPVFDPEN